MSRDTSPFRYTRWLALDLIRTQVAGFAIVAFGLALVMALIERSFPSPTSAASIQAGAFSVALTITVLVAIGGAIGTDLSGGFYRAWFSKPMAPAWYYFQRWLLGGVAVLLAPVLFGLALAVVLRRGFGLSGDLMGTVALAYLLIGSACLLVSNLTPRDWLVVFLIGAVERPLALSVAAAHNAGVELPTLLVWLAKILPPFHLINPMKPPLHGHELLHVLGYGIAMLVAALVIVQVRPLGSGGRA